MFSTGSGLVAEEVLGPLVPDWGTGGLGDGKGVWNVFSKGRLEPMMGRRGMGRAGPPGKKRLYCGAYLMMHTHITILHSL